MKVARGFTLVELLVALFILAMLAGLSWRGVDGIVRTRDASQERLDRQLRLQTVVAQWEADLAAIQDGGVVPLQFDGASLRLTRRTENGVQLIVWALRGARWMRWAGPTATTLGELQEGWLRSQQLLGNEAGQLDALGGVAAWRLYYWRNNAWTNAQSSGDQDEERAVAPGPGVQQQAPQQLLPGGVRIVLEFAEGSGLAGSLIRDVALAPQPSAVRAQQ
jgi:general secretion pathway protein J